MTEKPQLYVFTVELRIVEIHALHGSFNEHEPDMHEMFTQMAKFHFSEYDVFGYVIGDYLMRDGRIYYGEVGVTVTIFYSEKQRNKDLLLYGVSLESKVNTSYVDISLTYHAYTIKYSLHCTSLDVYDDY